MRSLFSQLDSTLSSRGISPILTVCMDTNKLISLVHVRTALWDQGDSRHHNRYVLDKLWGEVAHELCSTSKYISLFHLHVDRRATKMVARKLTSQKEAWVRIPDIFVDIVLHAPSYRRHVREKNNKGQKRLYSTAC
jgi:hypothetical protein